MGWFDGWPFNSKHDQKRKEQDFLSRVIPLGEGQKDKALATLRPLFRAKVKDQEILFAYIAAKDMYVLYEQTDEALQEAWKKTNRLGFTEEERRAVTALVTMDVGVTSLDDYPATEAVQKAAETVIA